MTPGQNEPGQGLGEGPRPAGRATGAAWLVFTIASLGWVFDVYEGQLFAIFKSAAYKDILGASASAAEVDWHANAALASFLVGGALGGLAFGVLGDRIGRVRVMALTILSYSAFSGLTYFATSAWQMSALRFLIGMGVGGEWAVAAALVAETFSVERRALASGTFHATSVAGVILAALTGQWLTGPGQWRVAFLLGLLPALLTVWIIWSLREPTRSAAVVPGGRLRELLGDPRWSGRAWIGFGLATVGLSSYWGIFAWVPELVGGLLDETVPAGERQATGGFAYLVMNVTGGLAGLLSFAPLADRFGRRATFALFHVGSLVLVPLTFLGTTSFGQAMVLLPVMGFFVLGMHAGYAIYFPELFPTRLRATGSSFCFNVGRLASGALLLVRGGLRTHLGFEWAVVTLSGVFVVGLLLLAFAPETKGRELPE